MKKLKWTAALLSGMLLFACVLILPSLPVPRSVFSQNIVTVGESGKDVTEMQGRLKYLGFYKGSIDGVFSWRTYWSLRNFQYEFGMTDIDGVLGPRTKLKLWEATKDWRPGAPETTSTAGADGNGADATAATGRLPKSSYNMSQNELNMMANAVYGESRGEPYEGQVAVAAVILNRTKSASFPSTPTGVIFQPGAFTAVSDGQIYLTPNETAKKAVQDALNGWDPSGGALYYFNPDTATSGWIWTRPQIKKIGQHIFCK
jgi:N-acetylmuramoyl-L-alanine amidase